MTNTTSPYQAPQSGMSSPPPMTPALEESSVPKVFGIIHIVYACLGGIAAALSVVGMFIMKLGGAAASEEIKGMDVLLETYEKMAIYGYIDAALKLVLGIVLLVSGIGLLKKKLWAQKVTMFWAITRIIIGVVMTVLTYGPSLKLQKTIGEIGEGKPGEFDQSQFMTAFQGVGAVMGVLILSIYPVLCLIFLSKKSAKETLV